MFLPLYTSIFHFGIREPHCMGLFCETAGNRRFVNITIMLLLIDDCHKALLFCLLLPRFFVYADTKSTSNATATSHSFLCTTDLKNCYSSIFRSLFTPLPRDEESYYTVPQIIKNRGYSVEIHHVTTEDGYILELHRIPAKNIEEAKIIYFQHGIFESSKTWLINPSERSLPFMLAKLGYDIWLGNARGNRYSRTHVHLDPRFTSYWQFSYDQMGEYDLPAVINYILTRGTNQSTLSYIGHSLGAALFSIAMIKHPELNNKIEKMFGLSPLVSANYVNAKIVPLGLVCRFYQPFSILHSAITGIRGLVVDLDGIDRFIIRLLCEQTIFQARMCRLFFNVLAGYDLENTDLNLIPRIYSELAMGTSDRTVIQFCQNFYDGEVFQAFDYGKSGNLEHYGTSKPLVYDLKLVTAPMYLFAGSVDRLVPFQDVEWLSTQVPNLKHFEVIEGYNHADFLWGSDVNERIYDKVISMLQLP